MSAEIIGAHSDLLIPVMVHSSFGPDLLLTTEDNECSSSQSVPSLVSL